jgi:AraC family transcriptional activator of pobA
MHHKDYAGEDIKIYNTLSEFYQALGIPLAQETEFTIHATDKLHQYYPEKSPLFRANYYSFVIIKEGRGRYILDSQTFDTQPCTIYFNNPGHIKGFKIIEPYYGYIITFSEKFLKQHIHETIFDEFPFLLAETVPPHYLSPAEFEPFVALCEQLLTEYRGSSPYKYKILSSLMMVFLLRIKEMFWDDYDPQEEGNQSSPIVITFKKNLEAHFRSLVAGESDQLFQVQDFAQLQGLHPNYLSTVIKRKTGKTVNTWIVEKTIAEAQALLAQSSQSIQEIAYQLAFQEPTHFSRFFKKHTGLTPSAFRRANRPGFRN